MNKNLTRRNMITAVGAASVSAVAVGLGQAKEAKGKRGVILGISCSPRSGKTTAAAVQVALDAVAEADANLRTELIDLGGMNIGGWNGTGFPKDDFQKVLPKLKDPNLAGLIIGSPVYFRTMSALCKAFLEQCAALRKPSLVLAGKPVGVLAVGQYRNGGQELVIQEIQAAMLCHECVMVGGRAPAFQGSTLVSESDKISGDEVGLLSAKMLGRHIADAAL